MEHHSEYTLLHFLFDVVILSIVFIVVILLRFLFRAIHIFTQPDALSQCIYDNTTSAIANTLVCFMIVYFVLCGLLRAKRIYFNRRRARKAQEEAERENDNANY